MTRLKPRVDELERRLSPSGPQSWVRIIQELGQTKDQAIAAYEVEHGPIGGENVIMRVIV